jgi:ankyrin repeat protein
LHIAAATLNHRMTEWLLEHGAGVNHPGPNGRTPLDMADGTGWRRAGDLERYAPLAELLRRHGAEMTDRSAVALGETEWVRARQAGGKLQNPILSAGGLLSVAVRHNRPEMLRMLLDFGFDPNERTRTGDSDEPVVSWGLPLHHCAGLGKYDMAEMLLERGADPNGQVYCSGSVMYSALHAKDERMAALLERYGGFADAATLGHLCMTDKVRQMLADFDTGQLREGSHNPNGTLIAELLWAGLRGGCPDIVRLALTRVDWPPDHEDWFGKLWSPLPQGSARTEEEHARFLECFRLVLERTDPNARHSVSGRTALHDLATPEDETADRQAVNYAAMLLDAGARTNIRDNLLKSTPLGWACRWGAVEMAKLLLARGADPIEADAEAWATPRAWAEKSGNRAVLDLINLQTN